MSQTPAFNTVAEPQTEYVFDYAREVEQFYARHSYAHKNLVFVQKNKTNIRVIGRPFDEDQLTRKITESSSLQKSLDNGEKCAVGMFTFDTDYCYVALFEEGRGFIKSREYWTWVLDHEIGHYLSLMHALETGDESRYVDNWTSERDADSYAALRNIQRFGFNKEFFSITTIDETLSLFRDPSDLTLAHFVTPIISGIATLAERRPDLFKNRDGQNDLQRAMKLSDQSSSQNHYTHLKGRPVIADYGEPLQCLLQFSKTIICEPRQATDATANGVSKYGTLLLHAILSGKKRYKGQTVPDTTDWKGIRTAVNQLVQNFWNEFDPFTQDILRKQRITPNTKLQSCR